MSDLVERLRVMIYEETLAKDARITELESRCADKDASIAQLIEQLQKAEAQNATFRCAVCDDAFDDRQSFDAHREGAGHNYRLPDRRE